MDQNLEVGQFFYKVQICGQKETNSLTSSTQIHLFPSLVRETE